MKAMRLIFFSVLSLVLGSCIDGEDPNKQLKQDMATIDQYLQSLGRSQDALYDNNYGFRFLVSQYGEYAPPHTGQKIKVHYEGRLFPSEVLFDSGTKEGKLEEVTPFAVAYASSQLMTGSSARIFVPSKYGYGEEGSSTLGVPPNAILIYDMYLESTERTTLEQSRFETDSTAIANYLETNEITATYHPGGIWYTITEQGSGDYPNVYEPTNFDYKVKILNATSNLQESSLQNQAIIALGVDGLKVGIPLLREGGKATFYIPSGLAYGTQGSNPDIPANSNLVFEISLTKVGS